MPDLIYDIGTVTLTNGSKAIVGAGTSWGIALVKGGVLYPEATGNPMPIAAVTDDSHALAAVAWKGVTGTYPYAIVRDSSEATKAVWTNDRLGAILQKLALADPRADPGVLMLWDVGVNDENPGPGTLRCNNASLAYATSLFISKTNRAGDPIASFLARLDDSTSPFKGELVLTAPIIEKQAIVRVGAVTDAGDYIKLAISGHSGVEGWDAGFPISLQFSRTGDLGDGDVHGPASSANNRLPLFSDGGGKNLKDSGVLISELASALAVAASLGFKADKATAISVAGLATGGGTLAGDRTITVPKATNAEALAGLLDDVAMTPLLTRQAIVAAGWDAFAPVATTSGTSIPLNSLPAGVTDIELWFNGVSAGANHLRIQASVAGAAVTGGYASASTAVSSYAGDTTGFLIWNNTATNAFSGCMCLHRVTGNTWIASYVFGASDGWAVSGGGRVDLGGAIDGLILSATGTAFDAGSVKMRYRL